MLARHAASVQRPLGEFLLDLKVAGDPLYKRFLNPYGDDTYCEFSIDDPLLIGVNYIDYRSASSQIQTSLGIVASFRIELLAPRN